MRVFHLSPPLVYWQLSFLHYFHVCLFDVTFTKFFVQREATVAGVFERFGVPLVSSVLAGYRYHNGVFNVWEYTVVLIWFGLAYNTDFCT